MADHRTEPPEVPFRDIHRVGGGRIDNLRLKPREATLDKPGISVIRASTPQAAARELRSGLPRAKGLHQQADVIGSASEEAIGEAGFSVVPLPSVALPNHYRIIHPQGAAGFDESSLTRLAAAFVDTEGHNR